MYRPRLQSILPLKSKYNQRFKCLNLNNFEIKILSTDVQSFDLRGRNIELDGKKFFVLEKSK